MAVLNVFIMLATMLIILIMGITLPVRYIIAKNKFGVQKKKQIKKEASNKYIKAHKLLLETMEVAGDTTTSGYSRDI